MSDILDSYFVVTDNSTTENSTKENERLKIQLNKLKYQVQALEQKSAESSLLKNSIVQFRNDVHQQAKRLRQTHEANMMTRSAITPTNKNMRTLDSSTIDMVNRVRELEEENRNIRMENKKQEALINKYRERWEKLEEGAKKRLPNNSLLKSLASNEPPPIIPE
ncbi:hypothetical protein K501DRAFT_285150 [Backusella circina FSU 941]|nr:hypothetical protein K501DRAFT_285150 [Backusella circina FSU 941]